MDIITPRSQDQEWFVDYEKFTDLSSDASQSPSRYTSSPDTYWGVEHEHYEDISNYSGQSNAILGVGAGSDMNGGFPVSEWMQGMMQGSYSGYPADWSAHEVCSWMNDTLQKQTPLSHMNYTGKDLINMSEREFMEADSECGSFLYGELRKIVSGDFVEPLPHHPNAYSHLYDQPMATGMESLDPALRPYIQDVEPLPSMRSFVTEPFTEPKVERTTPDVIKCEPHQPPSPASSNSSDEEQQPAQPKKRSRVNKRVKGHLWEFVLGLLKDSRYNPTVVKWEDKAQGVFRFVKSDAAAKLWGERKGNVTMTYEKMSRAMRYTRDMGYLDKVPECNKFPKRLCFRFGDFATGWRD